MIDMVDVGGVWSGFWDFPYLLDGSNIWDVMCVSGFLFGFLSVR